MIPVHLSSFSEFSLFFSTVTAISLPGHRNTPAHKLPFMKFVSFLFLAIPFTGFITADPPAPNPETVSPLGSFSPEWNNARYVACNTAANADYMTAEDKKLIYVLNLMRVNPRLFANSVLRQYPTVSNKAYLRTSPNYISLMKTLLQSKPMNLLYPDSLCFAGADCHAINSGLEGYTGHERSKEECRKKWYFNGECCDYGNSKALDILMDLMIDEGVPSLGHRKVCLGDYKKIGVSIQPHRDYIMNAVLDFHF